MLRTPDGLTPLDEIGRTTGDAPAHDCRGAGTVMPPILAPDLLEVLTGVLLGALAIVNVVR